MSHNLTASAVGAAGALLGAFGAGWHLSLQRVPPSADMAASPLQPLLAVAVRGALAEPPSAGRGEAEGGGDGAPKCVDAGDGAAAAACAAPQPVELCFRAAAVAGPAAAHMASIERARRPGSTPLPCVAAHAVHAVHAQGLGCPADLHRAGAFYLRM